MNFRAQPTNKLTFEERSELLAEDTLGAWPL